MFHRVPDCWRIRIKRDLAVLPLEDAARKKSPVTHEILRPCASCYPSEKGSFAFFAHADPEKVIMMVNAYEDGYSGSWGDLGGAPTTAPRTV